VCTHPRFYLKSPRFAKGPVTTRRRSHPSRALEIHFHLMAPYQPNRPLHATFRLGDTFYQAAQSPIFRISIAFFLFVSIGSLALGEDTILGIDRVVRYPAALFATLFSFMLGLFVNKCFDRFHANWKAAMFGIGRLNDLGLQVFAYVGDREVACDIIRLMHAANHLFYADFSGNAALGISLCKRRHLLTDMEIAKLTLPGGPPGFYLACSWALELIVNKSGAKEQYVVAMDASIRGWRQETTFLSAIALTPLPLPYFKAMIAIHLVFEVVVASAMAIAVDTLYVTESPLLWVLTESICFVLYAVISLVANALVLASSQLLNPWGSDSLDLPVEEYLLLPLAAHRNLFRAPSVLTEGVGKPEIRNAFLLAWDADDSSLLGTIVGTVGALNRARSFRKIDRANTMRVLLTAKHASPEINRPKTPGRPRTPGTRRSSFPTLLPKKRLPPEVKVHEVLPERPKEL